MAVIVSQQKVTCNKHVFIELRKHKQPDIKKYTIFGLTSKNDVIETTKARDITATIQTTDQLRQYGICSLRYF